MIISLNDIEYAVGLRWADELKKTSPYVEVVSTFIVGDHSGIQYGHAEKSSKDTGHQSLSAVIAQSRADGIFIGKDDNGNYCGCVIVDSLVVEGSDSFLKTIDDVELWLKSYEGSGDLIGVNKPIPELSIEESVSLPTQSLETCIILKSAYGTNYIGMVKLIIFVCVITGGFIGYNKWEEHQKQVQMELSKKAAAEELRVIRENIIGEINQQDFNSLKRSISIIKEVPSYLAGWKLSKLDFDIKFSTLILDYKNTGLGGNRIHLIDKLKDIGVLSSYVYTMSGEHVVLTIQTDSVLSNVDKEVFFPSPSSVSDDFYELSAKIKPYKINVAILSSPSSLQSKGSWSMGASNLTQITKGIKIMLRYKIKGISFEFITYSSSKKINIKGSLYAE